MTGIEVWAAGALPWRDGEHGVEVLVVHRPRYDDWTLPKGKRDPGETDEECALREVEEETGLRGVLGRELPSCDYIDSHGRQKLVRYWEMTGVEGGFAPNEEVDEIRWLPVAEASSLLSYERDHLVLAHFAELGEA